DPHPSGLYAVGVVARIAEMQRAGGGIELVVHCESRATALRYAEIDGILHATAIAIGDTPTRPGDADLVVALARNLREQALEYGRRRGAPEDVLREFIGSLDDPGSLANHIAFYVELAPPDKQEILETLGVERRMRLVLTHLGRQIELAETQE